MSTDLHPTELILPSNLVHVSPFWSSLCSELRGRLELVTLNLVPNCFKDYKIVSTTSTTFINSFIQHMLNECLLCARHCSQTRIVLYDNQYTVFIFSFIQTYLMSAYYVPGTVPRHLLYCTVSIIQHLYLHLFNRYLISAYDVLGIVLRHLLYCTIISIIQSACQLPC